MNRVYCSFSGWKSHPVKRCWGSFAPDRKANSCTGYYVKRYESTTQNLNVKPSEAEERARSSGLDKPDYLQMILTAKVYDVAVKTPLQKANNLSKRLGNNIYFKREDLQPVFSFKIRGAYNKIANLTEAERAKGIIACSAGNHAQGVALAATQLGIDSIIVMPIPTPAIKVDSVRDRGGNVVLHGDTFDEAKKEALRIAAKDNRTMIHPYDDPYVIAGQGTIGVEIMQDIVGKGQKLDAVFCCVGGGGLIAGVAAYIKRVNPNVKIIGVEAEDADAMTQSLNAKEIVTLDSVGLFADGAAVKEVGAYTFDVCKGAVDEMVTVSNDEICAAIKDGFYDTRTILEPAGALGVAGVKRYCAEGKLNGKTFVAVCSGANMNFDRLRFVSERSESKEALVAVTIPETPGSFQKLYNIIAPRNVTEFSYRYQNEKSAHICMSFQASSAEEKSHVLRKLEENHMKTIDLSENELAKAHGRHLAGGRSPGVKNERLIRFEFPEKPGALGKFLECIPSDFNVSLFHYRNHGADTGRVLAGIQVDGDREAHFDKFLQTLGYRYVDETDNKVYRQFLL
eukprot:Nk52_evm35s234 gene=Nk52_evmTU35s234